MDTFETKIADAIAADRLIEPGGSVVVGLSGGADSVALLLALTALGYRVVAAHCNFRLRGPESVRDRNHAHRVATAAGALWQETEFDTEAYARANSLCIEDACRRLRYGWFECLRQSLHAEAIAVAHHRDDQVETFFINLLRSAGPAGLRGMRPRNGHVVRPMLGVSRRDVADYLARMGVEGVTDSSNLSDDYLRNRLRHNLIPELRRASTVDADAAVTRSMAHLGESSDLLDALVSRCAGPYSRGDGWDVAAIAVTAPMPQAFLYQLLKPHGLRRDMTDAILAAATESGRTFTAAGRTWLLDRGVLRPHRDADSRSFTAQRLSDLPLSVSRVTDPVFSRHTLCLDPSADAADARWELRHWRHGDRIEPFGMRGSRLVSDILSDLHMPLDAKASVRVLTRNGTLLWVVGIRASRHFPVAGHEAIVVADVGSNEA